MPVYSPETMRWVLPMLEKATSKEGTAPLSQVPGYRVAGKTGTAKKLAGDLFGRPLCSVLCWSGASQQPRYVVAVMIDEPPVAFSTAVR